MYSKLRKVSYRGLPAFMIAILLTTTIISGQHSSAASAVAGPAENTAYHIVAVGDSLTAGYEHGFTEQSIPYGYVEQVYEQALFQGLRAEFSNYGVLGLKTQGLARWIEAALQGVSVKADDIQSNLIDPRAERIFAETLQLRSSLTEADLIIMTIGGNDMNAVFTKLEAGGTLAEAAIVLDNALAIYEKELEETIRGMAELRPQAQIVVADQYLPVPAPFKIKDTLVELYPEADRLFLVDGQKQLQERLDGVVARLSNVGINVKAANVADPFKGNELSFTSISEGDIHPSRSGYAAMGKAFANAIWDEYLTVKPRAEGVPISVVINGKELISSYKPVLLENRTFVPLREITEALGATVDWNSAAQTATIVQDGRTVDITIGAAAISVNGVKTKLNAQPAFLHRVGKESKTYLPLAALSEGLAFQVVYRDTLKTAFINK
ncbi:GDSL-type esterase/lipase family protein [Paenibacillus alkaliterrae]|uniref:stalk domain-containing protein n=1 Tax=Paenibacillus alkaliterrae TaxID=320909 RepID=UPI001EEB0802|nr:stalk domain-containing protein [Paenibacillus alkaliterrae]MCF2937779.1 GDSL-type esterase/lipase family protein [Paenibacillus alkaliterrae]